MCCLALNILRYSIAIHPSFTILQVDICMKPGIFVAVINCGHFSVDNGLFTREGCINLCYVCVLSSCMHFVINNGCRS